AARLHPHSFSYHRSAAPQISPLSLHDALPISDPRRAAAGSWRQEHRRARGRYPTVEGDAPTAADPQAARPPARRFPLVAARRGEDRKSTRLNSSHVKISYAVFCLKKKTKNRKT